MATNSASDDLDCRYQPSNARVKVGLYLTVTTEIKLMARELDFVVKAVSLLKPGQSITISRFIMREIPYPSSPLADYLMDMAYEGWTAADFVMEKIVGSAYRYTYCYDAISGNCLFARAESDSREPLQTVRKSRNL